MNYAALKEYHICLAKKHLAADMLIKGTYGKDEGSFKGCSVGCLSHDVDPERKDYRKCVAEYFKYPEWLVGLQDVIFEGLPDVDRSQWHVQLAETLLQIPEDYDWQKAYHRVQIAILRVMYQHAGSSKDVVQRVIDLHELAANGECVSADDWEDAERELWKLEAEAARAAVAAVAARAAGEAVAARAALTAWVTRLVRAAVAAAREAGEAAREAGEAEAAGAARAARAAGEAVAARAALTAWVTRLVRAAGAAAREAWEAREAAYVEIRDGVIKALLVGSSS